MTTKLSAEVGEQIRSLLRERDYASASDYAVKALDSLGIEIEDPGPSGPLGGPGTPGTSGTETVSGRMEAIFEETDR